MKKIVIYLFSTVTVLAIVLIVHLVIVMKPVPNNTMQLSRIDFEKSLSDDEAKEIVHAIKLVDGVTQTHVNKKDGILVYSYDNKMANAKTTYQSFEKNYTGSSKQFVVNEASLQGGCPVQVKNSLVVRFISGIQSVIQ